MRQSIDILTTRINLLSKIIKDLTTSLNNEPVEQPEKSTDLDACQDAQESSNISYDNEFIPQIDGAVETALTPKYPAFKCDNCEEEFEDPDDFIIHDSFEFTCENCMSCFPMKIAWDLHRCLERQERRKTAEG